MRISLGDLKFIISEVLTQEQSPTWKTLTVDVTIEDIEDASESKDTPYNLQGVYVYCPFRSRGQLPKTHRLSSLAAPFKLAPWEVINSVKKNIEKDAVDGTGRKLLLRADSSVKKAFMDRAASKIAQTFKAVGVTKIACPQSSQPMAEELAKNVASRIADATFVPNMMRKPSGPADAALFDVDSDAVNKWKVGKTPDQINKFMKVINDELNSTRKKIRSSSAAVSIAADMKASSKKFFTGYQLVNLSGITKDDVIGVVDDNLDSGTTFADLSKALEKAKVPCKFAAGFSIIRSSSAPVYKKEQISTDSIDVSSLMSGLRSTEELAAAGAAKKIPGESSYSVGDVVENMRGERGQVTKIEQSADGKRLNVTVNYGTRIATQSVDRDPTQQTATPSAPRSSILTKMSLPMRPPGRTA